MRINQSSGFHFGVNTCLAILLLWASSSALSTPGEALKPVTEDYEVKSLDIAYRADGIPARIKFRPCPSCALKNFKVSPNAIFRVKGNSVPLNHTRHLNGQSGAVIYNIQKQVVEKIIFF
jgi:hypothetical protein